MGIEVPSCTIIGSYRFLQTCCGAPKRQDRNKFSKLCDSLRVDQPEWSQFATLEEARRFCKTAGGG